MGNFIPNTNHIVSILQRKAVNSSHFVWLYAGLDFFQTSGGWIFAYKKCGEVTIIALEPVHSSEQMHAGEYSLSSVQAAWEEFCLALHVDLTVFVGVEKAFAKILDQFGFQSIQVGKEPWIDLSEFPPRGAKSKGVRAARNKAIRAGVQVSEIDPKNIATPKYKTLLKDLCEKWQSRRILEFSGFLNSTDPLYAVSGRRWFSAHLDKEMVGFLVATPIPGIDGYFLEDLILSPTGPHGVGELLTWAALETLQSEKVKVASLGLVSLSTSDIEYGKNVPRLILRTHQRITNISRFFYTSQGIDLFRKRFQPARWSKVFVSVGSSSATEIGIKIWLKVIFAIFMELKPTLHLNRRTLLDPVLDFFKTYSVTSIWLLQGFLFGIYAHHSQQFWLTLAFVGILLASTEKKQGRGFFISFLIASIGLDSFFYFLVKNHSHQFFLSQLLHREVSGGAVAAALLGLQSWKLKRFREPLIAVCIFAWISITVGVSHTRADFIQNLDLFLIFGFGIIAGKILIEYKRKISRGVCKLKSPLASKVIILED